MGTVESFVAKTLYGLEEVLAKELSDLGATEVKPLRRAVQFCGNQELLYRSNLCLRTALSILKPIHTFEAHNAHQLYKGTQHVDWAAVIAEGQTFAISEVVHSTHFNHSKFAALKVKDAIVDQIREHRSNRPDVDTKAPDIKLNLHIQDTMCTLSLDSSGEPLFKRGYRKGEQQAPLNEALAAGLILLAGWNGATPFIDPMCGSGTLPIEAAMIAANIPPGLNRKLFGFMNWRDFDASLWRQITTTAKTRITSIDIPIRGYDKSGKTIAIARENSTALSLPNLVFDPKDISDIRIKEDGGTLIINPPYGKRLEDDHLFELYQHIGDSLKQHFTGYEAWIISSNTEALKHVGLQSAKRIKLFNGALECSFRKYELYKGSRKEKHNTL